MSNWRTRHRNFLNGVVKGKKGRSGEKKKFRSIRTRIYADKRETQLKRMGCR